MVSGEKQSFNNLKHKLQTAYPQYLLVGPSKLCFTSTTQTAKVVTLSGQTLRYNWTLLVTEAGNQTSEGPRQRQRRNLLVWFGARELIRPAKVANVDELKINSSLVRLRFQF